MLVIRSDQMAQLHTVAEDSFKRDLLEQVRQSYPAYGKVDERVLSVPIDTALRRAACYGLSSQRQLSQFVNLMAAVAANFDLHPAVQQRLSSRKAAGWDDLESLVDSLPDPVWDDILANASRIGWFLDSNRLPSARAERIALALSRALPGEMAGGGIDRMIATVRTAESAGAQRGFQTDDAVFVYAAACCAYGSGFDRTGTTLPWVRDVFDDKSAIGTQVALLRMRLALDRALWI